MVEEVAEPDSAALGLLRDAAERMATWDYGRPGVFEVMLQRFGLAKDAALAKIGGIVHYLEVREALVPEAAGVQTLLQGASRRATSDDQFLAEAEKTFDLLYEAYFEPPRT